MNILNCLRTLSQLEGKVANAWHTVYAWVVPEASRVRFLVCETLTHDFIWNSKSLKKRKKGKQSRPLNLVVLTLCLIVIMETGWLDSFLSHKAEFCLKGKVMALEVVFLIEARDIFHWAPELAGLWDWAILSCEEPSLIFRTWSSSCSHVHVHVTRCCCWAASPMFLCGP